MKRKTKQKMRSFIDVIIFMIILFVAACGDTKIDLLAGLFLMAAGIIIILLLIRGILK